MISGGGGVSRRQLIKYGGIAGSAAFLAGCTDSQGEEDAGTTAATGVDAGGQEEIQEGDRTEFVYSTTQKPSSIDPHKALDELEGIIANTVYDPLLYYSYEFPPEVAPGIATDWEVSEDGRTYTFTIRDDATFHNGESVTADDVVFSVERVMTIQQGPSWMWSGFLAPDGATAVDETTVEITLENTYAPFVVTLPWLFIVNEQEILDNEADGDYGDHGDYATEWLEDNDAGSGPYALADRERGATLTMEMHNEWWGEFASGETYEVVTAELTQEVSTIAGKLRNGEAEMTDRWLPNDVYKSIGESQNAKLSETTTFSPYYVFMNTQKEPLDDVHVRRALAYAFDYETAINDILAGAEKLAGPLPSEMKYASTGDLPQYERNIEQAQAELEQSDYAPEEINVSYTYQPALTTNEDIGLLMQSALQPLNINFELKKAPWSQMVDMSTSVETSPKMFPLWNLVQYVDPDNLLYGMWHSSNVGSYINGSKYQNEEIDGLLEEGRSTTDEDERANIYAQIQRRIAEDAGAIFVCNDATTYGLNQQLQGFVDNGINGYVQQFHEYTSG